ncbi:MAG: hypothetical protein HUU38_09670 [Anaerolineales bacterium]|nr:hypothetical protein [Anaerolineales bacterium]
MRKKLLAWIGRLLGIVVLYYLIVFFSIIPWEMDSILDTMHRQSAVNREIRKTFDISLIAQVYANDPGACWLHELDLKRVRFVQQNPDLQLDEIGLLDVRTSDVLLAKQMAELRVAVENRMIAENRAEMTTDEQNTLSSFSEESGATFIMPSVILDPPPAHRAEPPSDLPTIPRPTSYPYWTWFVPVGFNKVFVFARITTSETPPFIERYSLIQKDNQWFITCICKVDLRDGICY